MNLLETAKRHHPRVGEIGRGAPYLLLFSLFFIATAGSQGGFAQDIEDASSAFVLRVREPKKLMASTPPSTPAKSKTNSKNKSGKPAAAPAKAKKPAQTSNKSNPADVKTISAGVINTKGNLPVPVYPPAALAVRANGAVNVSILVDENGDVVSATAISGHPLLRQASEKAALEAKFEPFTLNGQPVRVTGIIVYNFQ